MENGKPLVSICIPVYNGASKIYRALESCINQTYGNIEIIVIDNASTDNTKEIVERYTERDKRIKYFRNSSNIGPFKNLLKCFELAQGDFFQHLCHDDWLSKNYIEEGIKILFNNPKIGGVFSRVATFNEIENRFFFRNIEPKETGIYPFSYFLQKAHKNYLGGNSILGFFRTKDIKEALSFILEFLKQPQYKNFYEFYLSEVIVVNILSKYLFLKCTDRSVYIKIGHSQNLSIEIGGYRYKEITIIKKKIDFRRAHEQFYKGELKKYLLGFRVNFNIDIINNIIIYFIKNDISRNDLVKEFSRENLRLLFEGYSLSEKLLIFMGIVPKLLLRFFNFIKRILMDKFKKRILFYPLQIIFLEKSGNSLIFKS